MELTKLKTRLGTARKGHKLLKDKQDELMRQFIDLVKRNNELRKSVEEELIAAYKDFVMVGALVSNNFLEEAVMYPVETIALEVSTKHLLSVQVPKMEFVMGSGEGGGEGGIYPYGFLGTSDELDRAIFKLNSILPKLLELGEIEKSCNLLTDEIEKTRRRVNALEYMTIPQLEETIKYIVMKLDENERSNVIRLMKVKSMIEAEAAQAQRRQKAQNA
jgi:V/A-type H+-transporting ATPase subunit D